MIVAEKKGKPPVFFKSKTKGNGSVTTCSTFSRVWQVLHGVTSNFDWFILVVTLAVIG